MRNIRTIRDFEKELCAIVERNANTYKDTLEKYLRSLWGCVKNNKDQKPSLGLFTLIIENAFHEMPVPFNKEWLTIKKLSWNEVDGVYVIEDFAHSQKIVYTEQNVDDFRIVENTILFQIADLHRLGPQLDDPYRTMGLVSPSGASWYNFDIDVFLTIGIRDEPLSDTWLDKPDPKIDWTFLAALLEVGQGLE